MNSNKKTTNNYQNFISSVPPVKANINYVDRLGQQINKFSCDTKYYTKKGPTVRVIGYVR